MHRRRPQAPWPDRLRLILALVLASVLFIAAVAYVALHLATACADCGELAVRVAGNHLVNAQGTPIRLLGVNRSGAEYACVENQGVIAGPTSTEAIAAMTSWRIDAVRIPLNEDCWLGINGAPARYSGARYRAAIRAYVGNLNKAGLYVILDLHWNAPGGELAVGQRPMADLSHAVAFWASVARTFRADPAVMFDLYNEPNGISWQCWRDGCVLSGGWSAAGMQTLVNAVRSTGAQQPIIVTGIGSGNNLSLWLRYRPHDPVRQLVAGLHAYGLLSCNTVACWNRVVDPVARVAPVVATEVGEADCSASFTDRFMSWADGAGVSYLGWSWNPSGCRAPALITSWAGQPTAYGEGLRLHLIKRHAG